MSRVHQKGGERRRGEDGEGFVGMMEWLIFDLGMSPQCHPSRVGHRKNEKISLAFVTLPYAQRHAHH